MENQRGEPYDGEAAAEVVEVAGFLVRDACERKRVFLGDFVGGTTSTALASIYD